MVELQLLCQSQDLLVHLLQRVHLCALHMLRLLFILPVHIWVVQMSILDEVIEDALLKYLLSELVVNNFMIYLVLVQVGLAILF